MRSSSFLDIQLICVFLHRLLTRSKKIVTFDYIIFTYRKEIIVGFKPPEIKQRTLQLYMMILYNYIYSCHFMFIRLSLCNTDPLQTVFILSYMYLSKHSRSYSSQVFILFTISSLSRNIRKRMNHKQSIIIMNRIIRTELINKQQNCISYH